MNPTSCEHCGEGHDPSVRFCPQSGKPIAARLLPEGTMLEGKYRVGRVLGTGGMGAVFEATHAMLGHKVAVKVMLPELSSDQQMSARLIREGRAASATGHHNIARVTDMGWTDERALYVVMEYLEGRTLSELLETEGPLPLERAATLIGQVLEGLEAVHRASVIHRDLKPDNIMVLAREEGDQVKIFDFGISKIIDDDAKLELTSTGLVMGTPLYMSPEQSRGAAEVDHRADLYSVGAIYYKILTGQPPITAPSLAALMARLIEGAVDPPSKWRAEIPPALDAVVLRSLAPRPEQRYPDARSFRRAVGSVADGTTTAAELPTSKDAFDESSLVGLDEVGGIDRRAADRGPAPARAPEVPPAAAPAAAPAASPSAPDPFAPEEESLMPLELDQTPAPSSGVVQATSPPSRAPAIGSSARRRPQARVSLWVALVIAAGLAGVYSLYDVQRDARPPTNEEQWEAVSIEVITDPADARVFVDGVLQVGSPLRLPLSRQPFEMRVEAEGYRTSLLRFTPDRDQTLRVTLQARK
jgi:serine/threonine protein kinase